MIGLKNNIPYKYQILLAMYLPILFILAFKNVGIFILEAIIILWTLNRIRIDFRKMCKR